MTITGTDVSTYGNLSRSTYSGLAGNVTSSIGDITISRMGTMHDSCTHGSAHPNLIVTDKTTWSYYEALYLATLTTNVNPYAFSGYPQFTKNGSMATSVNALKGNVGFDALYFRGVPVAKDEKCTSGYEKMDNTYAHYKFSLILGNLRNLFDSMAILWKQLVLAY